VNLLVVSHWDLDGNSALHALAFGRLAHERGLAVTLAVPANAEPVIGLTPPSFPVLPYEDVLRRGPTPADGRVDLIHSFTPREHVRRFTERVAHAHGCPYVVHLEDNEWVVLADHVGASVANGNEPIPRTLTDSVIPYYRLNPTYGPAFLRGAAAATVVVERLLEHLPEGISGRVIWPGFDERLADLPSAESARARLGVPDCDLVVGYTGNVHHSNVGEVRSLYLAVRILRSRGVDALLLRTGSNQLEAGWDMDVSPGEALLELGFVERELMPFVLAASDVFVQPGGPGDFNDYRFPSKLPDCLVSGRPVVTGRTNLGLHLGDRTNAYVMTRGDALDIVHALEEIVSRPAEAAAIGANGARFALENLRWELRGDALLSLYEEALARRSRHRRSGPPPSQTHENEPPLKAIAFFLPQFHRIPENDEWWGEGFTDWTNVRRATPKYEGHYQPQEPTELGFYDLSAPGALEAQARLARESLLYGFCFYYYWFDGRRLLEKPLEMMLAAQLDLPFCVCWANENWTRRWDGLEHDVLLAQSYSHGWEDRLIEDLLPALTDDRYIRIRGAPLLLVYRPGEIPAMRRVTDRWRAVVARETGLDLHLTAVQSFGLWDPSPLGFDAAVEFPPHTPHTRAPRDAVRRLTSDFRGFLELYTDLMSQQLSLELPEFAWYRGVVPSWDNTARRGDHAHIVVGSSPERYATWLRKIGIQTMERASVQEPLVFVNAWNEWAEGTHLEPDSRYGRAWLDATRSGIVDAVRQHWAARRLAVDDEAAQRYLRATLPEIAP
jgi:glycosyltransferase involved in cell wall biosynthesis